ncbi:MAG: AbrB/MazE/SpoVT family DNA-binding domain-containing protein [Planctomycetota bacterium]
MTTLRVTTVGDGLGVVLPPEVLDRLQVVDGAEVKLFETPNGIILQRLDAEGSAQVELAARVMQEDQTVLRKLAE